MEYFANVIKQHSRHIGHYIGVDDTFKTTKEEAISELSKLIGSDVCRCDYIHTIYFNKNKGFIELDLWDEAYSKAENTPEAIARAEKEEAEWERHRKLERNY